MKPTPQNISTVLDDELEQAVKNGPFISLLQKAIDSEGIKTAVVDGMIEHIRRFPEQTQDKLNLPPILDYFEACTAHKDMRLSSARSLLERLCETHPHVRQFQYSLAIVYCQTGQLEQAIFAYKLSLACEPYPELGTWLPSYGETFQEAYETIDTDPLYYKALGLLKMGQSKDGIHFLKEACLCNPERTEFWSQLATEYALCEEWYNCYQALRPLIKANALDESLYRVLLISLVQLGEGNRVADIFRSEYSTEEHDYLLRLAYHYQSQDIRGARLKDITFKSTPYRKQARADDLDTAKTMLRVGLLTGALSKRTISNPIINFFTRYNNSNIHVTLIHSSTYIDPMTQNCIADYSNVININKIDRQTLQTIIKRENYSMLIDEGNIFGDKRVLFSDPSLPCMAWGLPPDEAQNLGYSGTVLDKLTLSPSQLQTFEKDPSCIIPDSPLSILPPLKVDPTRVGNMATDEDRQLILLSLPPQHDPVAPELLEHFCLSLPDGWNFVVNSAYSGGDMTVDYVLDKMNLSKAARSRIGVVADVHQEQLNINCQGIVDLYGQPNPNLLTRGIALALPIFYLQRKHPLQRTSLSLMKQLPLDACIADTKEGLAQILGRYCDNKVTRKKMRTNIADRLSRGTQWYDQINHLSVAILDYLYD